MVKHPESTNPINVEVTLKPNETVEHMIRRFLRKMKKEDFMKEVKEHLSYEKPSDRKRRKRKEADLMREKENQDSIYNKKKRKKQKKIRVKQERRRRQEDRNRREQ